MAFTPAADQRAIRHWVITVGPVLAIAVYGTAWIALHASARGATHNLFQGLALAESLIALLMRDRKPLGALGGIVAVYMLVDLEALLLPGLLLALLTVVMLKSRTTAMIAAVLAVVAISAMPYLHSHPMSVTSNLLLHLPATAAVLAGFLLRRRRALAGPRIAERAAS